MILAKSEEVVVHGGPDLAELARLRVEPAALLDFSVCTNPFGPPPGVRAALAAVAIDQYPDRDAHALRTALAEKYAISPRRILAGNGVSELIWLTALALLRPTDRVLTIGPTYGEYVRSARLREAAVHAWNARERDGFAADPGGIRGAVEQCRPRMVFLCNPNNPTGAVIEPEWIVRLARENAQTLFVVDEVYQAFVPGLGSLMTVEQENLLVLRSLTKDYALAGLRIGYMVGSSDIIDAVARVRPPWSVNSFALAAASAALGDDAHLADSLGKLRAAKAELIACLTRLGFGALPSATQFFLMRVGAAAGFRLKLLRRGILVRDAASFGLPAFVRISTRRPEDNARLLSALAEELA